VAHLVTAIIRQGNYWNKNNQPAATVVAGCETEEEAREAGRQKLAQKTGYLVSVRGASRIQRGSRHEHKDMDRAWHKANLVAFDVETTGLDYQDDDILELGFSCRSLEDGFLEPQSFLLGDADTIPAESSKIHGITEEDIAGKPTFAERFEEDILPLLEKADALIAHNRGFDAAFLFQAMAGEAPRPPIFCGMEVAKEVGLGTSNYKLGTLADEFGFDQENAHRAGEDALIAGKVFFKVALGCDYFRPPCSFSEAVQFFDQTHWPQDPPEVIV